MKKILLIIVILLAFGLAVKLAFKPKSANGPQPSPELNQSNVAPVIIPKPGTEALPSELESIIDRDARQLFSDTSFSALEYSYKSADLNADNIEEYFVDNYIFDGMPWSSAAGNGPIEIYGKIDDEWKNIGELEGNSYKILAAKTGSYHDIETTWHISAATYISSVYKWDDSIQNYSQFSSEEVAITP